MTSLSSSISSNSISGDKAIPNTSYILSRIKNDCPPFKETIITRSPVFNAIDVVEKNSIPDGVSS